MDDQPTMPGFTPPKYSDEQRDAVAHAALDRGLAPKEVARLAAAGQLEHEGRRLDAFDMPAASVGTYAYRLKQRRKGIDTGELGQQEPRDAIEILRKRLVRLADRELSALERKQRGSVDPERIRQTARAVREIAALPGPTDPTPLAPGAKTNGQQNGGQTRGGLAGPLLADHRQTQGKGRVNGDAEPAPTPSTPPQHTEQTRDARAQSAQPSTQTEREGAARNQDTAPNQHEDGSPGAAVHALAARVALGDERA